MLTSLNVKRGILCLFLTVIFCFPGCSNKPANLNELNLRIEEVLSNLEGDFSVAYLNPTSGDSIFINTRERFHAASTMKTPVMIELFNQIEKGKYSLNDSVVIKTTFTSIADGSQFTMTIDQDSESELYELVGQKTTLSWLNYLMITKSSNLATNILIDLLDAKKITNTMRGLGADSIHVLRGVEDIKAFEAGMSNSTTSLDLLRIYQALGSDSLISPSANDTMIQVLLNQQFNDMIPAGLPPGTPVAHKTGWITNVHHDAGIIFLPDNDSFILIFLSKDAPNREAVLDACARISELIYMYETAN